MSAPSNKRSIPSLSRITLWGICCLGLVACHPRAIPDQTAPDPGVAGPSAAPARSPESAFIALDQLAHTPQSLLNFVPARAKSALVLFQVDPIYRQAARLERILKHNPQGIKLVDQLHHLGELLPLPIPWHITDLKKWGLDPRKPLLGFITEGPVALLYLADKDLFKKSAALLLKAQWSRQQHQGLALSTLAAETPVVCHFSTQWTLCGSRIEHVIEALRQTPSPTLWSTLSPHEREVAGQAAALFSFKGSETESMVTATIHDDGLGLQLRMDGVSQSSLHFLTTNAHPSTLLGLAKDARWVLRARYNLAQLLKLSPQMLITFALLGLDGVLLAKSLTGEVLLYQRAPGELALVISSTDLISSQQVVEALGIYLRKQFAKDTPARNLPRFKIRKISLHGRPAYRIQATTTPALRRKPESLWRRLPSPMTFGLAAGPLGIVLGTWPLVEEVSQAQSLPPATFLSSLATEEDKKTFDADTSISFLGTLGDPLAPLAADLKKILLRNPDGDRLLMKIEVGRFLLDQLQRMSMSYQISDQNSLRVRLRLTTLHRDHTPEDDQAQEIWLKGLQAKYRGALEPFRRALSLLHKRFPDSRDGALRLRHQPGQTALTGATLLAAHMMPSILEELRRPSATEIHPNLARIVSAAKFSHDPRKGFPRTTAWTPLRSCCKTGGVCPPDPKQWDHPTWKALRFSITEAHRYQYRFIHGKNTFTAEARGDLNCDGISSRFSIQGILQEDGSVSLSAMKTKRPLE